MSWGENKTQLRKSEVDSYLRSKYKISLYLNLQGLELFLSSWNPGCILAFYFFFFFLIYIIVDVIGFFDSAELKATVFPDDIALNLEGNEEKCS